ncbi:hypothetical protein [Diaphorobacter nitroreducens]|uniref:type III secretion apparatus assembly protein SctX n=1 Tax=Diaphorobacter nitroreducens TaxID=164759 RepID=UPI0035B131E2
MVDGFALPPGQRGFFDRGIESITGTPEAPELLQLPDTLALAPAAMAQPTALDELLGVHNLDSLLEAACRPEVAGRELLSPQRFGSVLDEVAGHFAQAAQARRDANPRVGRLLDSACHLLAEEAGLRELLLFYRNALLQG